ncbi:SapC [Marinobacter sp. Z-F4-2]|nr:SapC [Marinobacter sp. Z-F4-2]
MPQWTIISRQQHASARYKPRQGYEHAREQIITPILLAELPKLINQYVLGFIPNGSQFQAVALLGIEQGHNLYVNHDGRWIGDYVPANVRGYPFALAPDNKQQLVLCVDADQLVNDASGHALFDDKGEPAEQVTKTLEFLNQCDADRRRTQTAVNALQQAGVLQAWKLEFSRGEGEEPKRVEGLYRIDEKVFNTLDSETFASLQGAPMALAYAHLFSVQHQRQLVERSKYFSQHARQELPEDLDKFFDGDDDLSFSFD